MEFQIVVSSFCCVSVKIKLYDHLSTSQLPLFLLVLVYLSINFRVVTTYVVDFFNFSFE